MATPAEHREILDALDLVGAPTAILDELAEKRRHPYLRKSNQGKVPGTPGYTGPNGPEPLEDIVRRVAREEVVNEIMRLLAKPARVTRPTVHLLDEASFAALGRTFLTLRDANGNCLNSPLVRHDDGSLRIGDVAFYVGRI